MKLIIIAKDVDVSEVVMSVVNERRETLMQHSFNRTAYSCQPAIKKIKMQNNVRLKKLV